MQSTLNLLSVKDVGQFISSILQLYWLSIIYTISLLNAAQLLLVLDINECAESSKQICNELGERCVNTLGRYQCFCKIGFRQNPNTKKCEGW